ncbi:MAG: protein kinase [Methylococcales bacterium]|nr:protein kinase [Methylococcales bacterium]
MDNNLARKHYKVVFRGEIQTGKDPFIVKEKLSELYQNDMDTVDRLFGEKTIILSSNMNLFDAEKYWVVINDIGAVCGIEEMEENAPVLDDEEEMHVDDYAVSNFIASLETNFTPEEILKHNIRTKSPLQAYQTIEQPDSPLTPKKTPEYNVPKLAESNKNMVDSVNNERVIIQSSITYELYEKIGSGGMGEVFKAKLYTNIGTSETVVIKKIKSDFVNKIKDDAVKDYLLDNFKRETSILSELNGHPNIVGFRGADCSSLSGDGSKELIFVMEYVDGFDLNRLMRLHNISTPNIIKGNALKLPDNLFGFILFKIANALDYAHTLDFSDGQQGIIHLDISPGNILINSSLGLIKLSDFGISSSVDEFSQNRGNNQILSGKPYYVSPEVIDNQKVDFSTDFYSLGITMYQLATGICPNMIFNFKASSQQELRDQIRAHQQQEIIPPHKIVRGFSEELSEIILSLIQDNPENRISSANQLRDLVGHCIYDTGYGPTDSSFAKYLSKIQLLKIKDKEITKLLKIFGSDMEPLKHYHDVVKKFSREINPCRKS